MARPKEFDRDEVLALAVQQFGTHGFEGTSTDMLLKAMGISRQSLYDTFGDKRALYLTALQHYGTRAVSASVRALNTAASPRKGIDAAFEEFIDRPVSDGCLGIGSICEFGTSNEDVTVVNETAGKILLGAFERRLVDAKALGEVAEDLDPREGAMFLVATFSGLRLAARGGASPKELRTIARVALRSLG